MTKQEIYNNVAVIANKAQKAGLFELEESAIILETLKGLQVILQEETEEGVLPLNNEKTE